ncbi:MAG: TraR/DksA family transcriptional regulator [Planctomycetota bacterium]|jgi:RNA polymerase-binding transcription factor DksA
MAKTTKQAKRKTSASKTRTSKAKPAKASRPTARKPTRSSTKARPGTKAKAKSKATKRVAKKQPAARGKPAAAKAKPARKGAGKSSAASKAKAGSPRKRTTTNAARTGSKTKKAKSGSAGPSVADRARKAVARNARRAVKRPAAARTKAPPAEKKEKKKRVRTKSPYTRRSLAPLRTTLLTLRTRLVGDIDLMGREALRADASDVNSENMADHGSDAFERHMTLELMENEARTLRKINEALDLMDGGTYGLCGVCSEPIPLARLQALPFAGNCVGCQAAQERQY